MLIILHLQFLEVLTKSFKNFHAYDLKGYTMPKQIIDPPPWFLLTQN